MTSILDVVKARGDFKTLVQAVEAAGMVDTANGPGPFTAFSPTDEAFGKVPSEMVQGLINDVPALTAALTYHLVPGKLLAKDLQGKKTLKTIQGGELVVEATPDGLKVNGAKVTEADLVADNGVVHVIDTVLMPGK